MAEDDMGMYPSEGGPAAPEETKPDQTEEEQGSETALLPKSLFGDAKVGDTLSVKVTHIYEEEIEVEPVSEAQEESEETAGDMADLQKYAKPESE